MNKLFIWGGIAIIIILGVLAFIWQLGAGADRQPENLVGNQDQDQGAQNNQDTSLDESGIFLDLSNKNLANVPMDVFSQTGLEGLDISENQLTGALPAEIRKLENLKILIARDNLMTGVPAEIGQLQNLEVLDLANNKLTGLPYEMGNLSKLKVLDLSGNSYSAQDLDAIKKKLPADVQIIAE